LPTRACEAGFILKAPFYGDFVVFGQLCLQANSPRTPEERTQVNSCPIFKNHFHSNHLKPQTFINSFTAVIE